MLAFLGEEIILHFLFLCKENIFQQWMRKADFGLPLSYDSSFGGCLFDFVPLTGHVRSKEPAAASVGLCEFDGPD
ncbi:L-aspartate decarboxylase [Trichinella spiralis]|uniref:L-aspartate decarboxylase n=1 Tax=Trichinella spiralis TaxID=6334 RepID=A0ABR3L0A1_TRISP